MEGLIDRNQLTAYLLGELSPEEQLRVERDYFTEDAAYENLLAAEDELMYEYAEGRLSDTQRRHYEATIGATERGRHNLEFARSLLRALRSCQVRIRPQSSPRNWWMLAAAALLLAVLPAWLAFRVAHLNADLAALRTDSAAAQGRLASDLAAARSAPSVAAPVEVAFLLTPGRSRAEDAPTRLALFPSAGLIRFELVPPPGAAPGDYAVAIHASSDAEVYSGSAAFSGRTWIVQTPAVVFKPGTYELTVRRLAAGEQPPILATYSFSLTSR